MGNQLTACCGQRKEVDEDKKPFDKHKVKGKKNRVFSKRRKDGRRELKNSIPTESATPTNPNAKEVICVSFERQAEWSPGEAEGELLTAESLAKSITKDVKFREAVGNSSSGSRRQLYPSSLLPQAVDPPVKPRRLYADKKRLTPNQQNSRTSKHKSPVLKFAKDGDILTEEPKITLHERMEELPEETKQLILAEDKHIAVDKDLRSKIGNRLMEHDIESLTDDIIKEQYDIILIANPSEVSTLEAHEVIVLLQREVQKIYIIASPEYLLTENDKITPSSLEDSKPKISSTIKVGGDVGTPLQPKIAATPKDSLRKPDKTPISAVHQSSPPKVINSVTSRSTLQATRNNHGTANRPQTNEETTPKSEAQKFQTVSKMEWKVKGPAPTYKPVKLEVTLPQHSTPKVTEIKDNIHARLKKPREEKQSESELSQTSSAFTRQSPAPGSKAAAVALLSNKLQAAQLKDNVFTAELKNEPKPARTQTSTVTAAREPPIESASSFAKSLSRHSSAEQTVDLPKSQEAASPGLSTQGKPERVIKPVPLRPIAGVSSIKDRLARFSSSDNLQPSQPSFTKRSSRELIKAQPNTPMGIESHTKESKPISNESDHSREGSVERSQSNSSQEICMKHVSTVCSGSVVVASEFESCLSSSSADNSPRYTLEGSHDKSLFGLLSSSDSFHSLSSLDTSRVTVRSTSCPSLGSSERFFSRSSSFFSVVTSTPTKELDSSASSDYNSGAGTPSRSPCDFVTDERFASTEVLLQPSDDPSHNRQIIDENNSGHREAIEDYQFSQLELLPDAEDSVVSGAAIWNSLTGEPFLYAERSTESKDITGEIMSEESDIISSGAEPTALAEGEKPKLGTGRIAQLSKSFTSGSGEEQEAEKPERRRLSGASKTFDSSTSDSADVAKSTSPTSRRASGGGLAAKLKMFNSAGSNAPPMEFGVHISTTKPLEELTKQSKSIYVSMEEKKKRESIKATEESSSTKVTTQMPKSFYQSTVKVEAGNSFANNPAITVIRIDAHQSSVSYESFDRSGLASEPLATAPLENHSIHGLCSLSESLINLGSENSDCISDYPMSDSSSCSDRKRETTDGFTTADEAILSFEHNDYLFTSTNTPDELSEYSDARDLPDDHISDLSYRTCSPSIESDMEDFDDSPVQAFHTEDSELSHAARISNFLEYFARNSNESVDSVVASPAEADDSAACHESGGRELSESSAHVHPLVSLTRGDSVRSSFDIYMIHEESDEEVSSNTSKSTCTKQKLPHLEFQLHTSQTNDVNNTTQLASDSVAYSTCSAKSLESCPLFAANVTPPPQAFHVEGVPFTHDMQTHVLELPVAVYTLHNKVLFVNNEEVPFADVDDVFVSNDEFDRAVEQSTYVGYGEGHNLSSGIDEGFSSYSELADVWSSQVPFLMISPKHTACASLGSDQNVLASVDISESNSAADSTVESSMCHVPHNELSNRAQLLETDKWHTLIPTAPCNISLADSGFLDISFAATESCIDCVALANPIACVPNESEQMNDMVKEESVHISYVNAVERLVEKQPRITYSEVTTLHLWEKVNCFVTLDKNTLIHPQAFDVELNAPSRSFLLLHCSAQISETETQCLLHDDLMKHARMQITHESVNIPAMHAYRDVVITDTLSESEQEHVENIKLFVDKVDVRNAEARASITSHTPIVTVPPAVRRCSNSKELREDNSFCEQYSSISSEKASFSESSHSTTDSLAHFTRACPFDSTEPFLPLSEHCVMTESCSVGKFNLSICSPLLTATDRYSLTSCQTLSLVHASFTDAQKIDDVAKCCSVTPIVCIHLTKEIQELMYAGIIQVTREPVLCNPLYSEDVCQQSLCVVREFQEVRARSSTTDALKHEQALVSKLQQWVRAPTTEARTLLQSATDYHVGFIGQSQLKISSTFERATTKPAASLTQYFVTMTTAENKIQLPQYSSSVSTTTPTRRTHLDYSNLTTSSLAQQVTRLSTESNKVGIETVCTVDGAQVKSGHPGMYNVSLEGLLATAQAFIKTCACVVSADECALTAASEHCPLDVHKVQTQQCWVSYEKSTENEELSTFELTTPTCECSRHASSLNEDTTPETTSQQLTSNQTPREFYADLKVKLLNEQFQNNKLDTKLASSSMPDKNLGYTATDSKNVKYTSRDSLELLSKQFQPQTDMEAFSYGLKDSSYPLSSNFEINEQLAAGLTLEKPFDVITPTDEDQLPNSSNSHSNRAFNAHMQQNCHTELHNAKRSNFSSETGSADKFQSSTRVRVTETSKAIHTGDGNEGRPHCRLSSEDGKSKIKLQSELSSRDGKVRSQNEQTSGNDKGEIRSQSEDYQDEVRSQSELSSGDDKDKVRSQIELSSGDDKDKERSQSKLSSEDNQNKVKSQSELSSEDDEDKVRSPGELCFEEDEDGVRSQSEQGSGDDKENITPQNEQSFLDDKGKVKSQTELSSGNDQDGASSQSELSFGDGKDKVKFQSELSFGNDNDKIRLQNEQSSGDDKVWSQSKLSFEDDQDVRSQRELSSEEDKVRSQSEICFRNGEDTVRSQSELSSEDDKGKVRLQGELNSKNGEDKDKSQTKPSSGNDQYEVTSQSELSSEDSKDEVSSQRELGFGDDNEKIRSQNEQRSGDDIDKVRSQIERRSKNGKDKVRSQSELSSVDYDRTTFFELHVDNALSQKFPEVPTAQFLEQDPSTNIPADTLFGYSQSMQLSVRLIQINSIESESPDEKISVEVPGKAKESCQIAGETDRISIVKEESMPSTEDIAACDEGRLPSLSYAVDKNPFFDALLYSELCTSKVLSACLDVSSDNLEEPSISNKVQIVAASSQQVDLAPKMCTAMSADIEALENISVQSQLSQHFDRTVDTNSDFQHDGFSTGVNLTDEEVIFLPLKSCGLTTSLEALSSASETIDDVKSVVAEIEDTFVIQDPITPNDYIQTLEPVARSTPEVVAMASSALANESVCAKSLKVASSKDECVSEFVASELSASSANKPAEHITPKEFYADLKLKLIQEQFGAGMRKENLHATTTVPPKEKFNKINASSNLTSPIKSGSSGVNNNSITEPAKDMKWRATSYNAGLKSAARLSTLPVFTTKLRNCYGRQGDTLKLQCCVDGEPTPVLSWLKEGKPLAESERIRQYEEKGKHILEIAESQKEDSGRYTVKAHNSKGTAHCSADVEIAAKKVDAGLRKTPKLGGTFRSFSKSEEKERSEKLASVSKQVDDFHSEANSIMAELDALTPKSHQNGHGSSHHSPPSFTVNLEDCEVEEGQSLDLVCKTEGEDPGLEHSPPQFVKILHDETVEEGDSVTILCKSSQKNDHGMKTRAPEFTQKLTDQEVTEGDSLTIEVHGSHDYHQTAPPRFVQELKDEEVEEGQSVTIECKSSQSGSPTGAPVFVKKLSDVVADEGGSLTLECQNYSIKTSPHSPPHTAPTFLNKLEDHEVEEGDSVTIECRSADHPYGSQHKTERKSQVSPDSSQQTNKPRENTSPKFIKALEDNQVEEGDSLTISCQSSGYPRSFAQKPKFIKQLSNHQLEEGDSLTIACQNSTDIPTPRQKPAFVKSLSNQEAEEGDSLTLSCSTVLEGRGQEGKEGDNSPKGQEVEERQEKREKTTLKPSSPKFVKELSDAEVEEGQSLIMECSQLSSTASTTLPATEDSFSNPTPPSIVRELTDVTVNLGAPTELMMETTGSLPIDIVWVHNADELEPDDPDFVQVSEGHVHRLIITAAFPDDSGTYICEAYNDFGEADTACELLVLESPAVSEPALPLDLTPKIVEPLQDAMTITDDSVVELVCRISNVAPEDVTWTKNDRRARKGARFTTSASGDTFSYKIEECMSIDKGVYTVTASNEHGEVSSSCSIIYSARASPLTRRSSKLSRTQIGSTNMVTTPPKFTSTLSDSAVSEMECAVLECKVEATPNPTVGWFCNNTDVRQNNNVSITLEAGLARLTIKEAELADQGRYTAVASNSAGTAKCSCFLNVHKPLVNSKSLLPEAPSKPSVTNVTSEGATVSWPEMEGVDGYQVEMCKVSLLSISPTEYWKSLISLCKSNSYRVTQMATSSEYVFRIRAVNSVGEGEASEHSAPVLPTDRKESTRSISTIGDSESVDYSEYSDYADSEYDPDLDEAFLEHDVVITKDKKLEDYYDVLEELGKGKFGQVHLVVDKVTKRQWAAKKLKCRPKLKPDIMNEVDIMNTLRHPKLVRLWEVLDLGREIILVQEYVGGGELFERIADDDFEVKETDCIRFMKQICEGINYMHSKSIIHLDIKPENVMCVSKHSNQIKLIDFGLARKFTPGQNMKAMFGTPDFVAPEVISYDAVSYNTDMWSIGVITYVLLSGLSPFMGDSDPETLSNVTRAQWDFEDEAFDEISDTAKDFISKLLVKKVEDRMTASAALKHVWLAESNKQKEGNTLSKSKSKMKKFLARRKWQKTVKAMVAIRRMQSTFKVNKDSVLTSPSSKENQSDLITSKKLARQSTDDSETTPTQSPLCISTYEEAVSSGPLASSATPTSKRVFEYPEKDSKFSDCVNNNANIGSFQMSPSTSDEKGHLSDTMDSGYEGRKSTTEITEEIESEMTLMPTFIQELPSDVHILEGDCTRFDVRISSQSAVEVSWYKDSEPILLTDRIELVNENQKYSLIIRNVQVSDDAEYECRVRNEMGDNSCFVELNIFRSV